MCPVSTSSASEPHFLFSLIHFLSYVSDPQISTYTFLPPMPHLNPIRQHRTKRKLMSFYKITGLFLHKCQGLLFCRIFPSELIYLCYLINSDEHLCNSKTVALRRVDMRRSGGLRSEELLRDRLTEIRRSPSVERRGGPGLILCQEVDERSGCKRLLKARAIAINSIYSGNYQCYNK